MGEEAAILAAVAANPLDDLPRLAYADWLDDHAADLPDSDAARLRAEFIRVQCEIARLEHLPSPELQRYADLYRRQDSLLTNHRRELLGRLADVLGPNDAVFDRGFVAELRLEARAFADDAGAVDVLRPRPDLTVTDVAAQINAVDGQSRWSDLVTAVEAQSERRAEPVAVSPDLVLIRLAWRPPWNRLRRLNLEGCRIGDEGLGHFGRPDSGDIFPALTHLDLSGNEISDNGVRSLAASPLWPRLTHLVLGGNPLSNEAAEVLADAAGSATKLEYLNLRFTGLTTAGHRLLLRKFPRRTKLD
ncbi:MAG: TIGR02996 domain-containing protein, partial [Gemmataceae bacterium]|nr:TIGR02996 domain-containing protein [Gemmataceae bacterium]